jgi:hypothetical protein
MAQRSSSLPQGSLNHHMGRDHYLFKKTSLVQLFRGIYGLGEPTARTTVDDIVTDILGRLSWCTLP